MRRFGRHIAADLRHQRDKCGLAQQSRFTSHVRACDNHDLLVVVAQMYVVGHITFARRQLLLNHRVTALLDVDVETLVNHRAVIFIVDGGARESAKAVELRNELRVGLNGRNVVGDSRHEFAKQSVLDNQNLLLRTENLLLVVLQFLGDVTLGIDQRLLAHPFCWHLILVGVAHLDVVAKHIVVGDFQAWNACAIAFFLLQSHQVVLARHRDFAQFVELRVNARLNHIATVHLVWRIGVHLLVDTVANELAKVDAVAKTAQHIVVAPFAQSLNRLQGLQRALELHQFARRDAAHSHLRNQALDVAHQFQLLLHQFTAFHILEEVFHHVEAAVDGLHVLQREQHPSVEHTRAHRRKRAVDYRQQTLAIFRHRSHEFEVTDGELVEAHKAVGLDASEGGDMLDLRVLGEVEVMENGTCRLHALGHALHAKALEVLRLEVAEQSVGGAFLAHHPVVEFKC